MTSVETAPVMGMRAILKLPNYRKLWTGQVISDFGDGLTNLALVILVNNLTGSVAAVATMGIVLAVPQVTFGLLAGVYVDRLNRKHIMLASDLLRALLVLAFMLVGSAAQLWLLFLIGFLQASVGTFFGPARSAILPHIVPAEGLMAANSLSQMGRIIFGLLGTAGAGFIIGLSGIFWPAFAIDALTFFASFLLVSRIKVAAQPGENAGGTEAGAVFHQLFDGVKLIFRTRLLLGSLIATGVSMLGLGSVNVLIVPLVVNDLKVPPAWFSVLEFAQTAAMLLSGGMIAFIAAPFKATRIISVGLVLIGFFIGLTSLVPDVWYMLPLLFAVGAVLTPLQASVSTVFQSAVSDEMRGRASASLNTMINTTNLLSMVFAGIFGEFVGVRNVFILAGALAIIAGLASALVFRERQQISVRYRSAN